MTDDFARGQTLELVPAREVSGARGLDDEGSALRLKPMCTSRSYGSEIFKYQFCFFHMELSTFVRTWHEYYTLYMV